MAEVRRRVAVYAIRAGESGPELLDFDHRDHPEAGLQVPAGGVLPGEDDAMAALREVLEETGLSEVVLGRRLGVQRRPHPVTGQPRETTFWLATTAGGSDAWTHAVTSDGDDDGLAFGCRFLPVGAALGVLADGQDEYLPRLLTP